jgi:hypothetical protein
MEDGFTDPIAADLPWFSFVVDRNHTKIYLNADEIEKLESGTSEEKLEVFNLLVKRELGSCPLPEDVSSPRLP